MDEKLRATLGFLEKLTLRPAELGRAGVPNVTLMQDATAYFDVHHTANDTLDKVNARDLDYNVAAWAAVAYAAAELPGDFGRVPPPAEHH